MKKKALTMVLAATMLFSMVGCGSTGTADNGSSNNAAVTMQQQEQKMQAQQQTTVAVLPKEH